MNTLLTIVERAGTAIAGACIIAIMIVISADAAGRYIFNAPLQWTTDVVSSYLMVCAVYLPISETFRRGDHININLVQSRMSQPVRAMTGALYSALAAVVFAVIAFGCAQSTIEAFQGGEFIPGYLSWPLWLSHLPVALGAAVLAARLALHTVRLAFWQDDPAANLDSEHLE